MESIEKIQGWLRNGETEWLQILAKEQQRCSKLNLLEIGSWKGRSGIAIASVLEEGRRLWMIDHFQGSKEHQKGQKYFVPPQYLKDGKPWAFPELLENVIKYGMQNKVVILPLNSQRAAQVIDEKFCFIFIDGDHSYEGVSMDWRLWSPHLEKNGIVIFHDAKYPPIKKFCDELRANKNLEIKLDKSMVAFRKL